MAARGAWGVSDYERMSTYVQHVLPSTEEGLLQSTLTQLHLPKVVLYFISQT